MSETQGSHWQVRRKKKQSAMDKLIVKETYKFFRIDIFPLTNFLQITKMFKNIQMDSSIMNFQCQQLLILC